MMGVQEPVIRVFVSIIALLHVLIAQIRVIVVVGMDVNMPVKILIVIIPVVKLLKVLCGVLIVVAVVAMMDVEILLVKIFVDQKQGMQFVMIVQVQDVQLEGVRVVVDNYTFYNKNIVRFMYIFCLWRIIS